VPRVAAPVAPVPAIDSEAKLAFVEFLLTSIDVQESARRAVDWLVTHAPVREAVVLVTEGLSNEMLLVAEHGVSSGAIMDFALSRDDASHPLIEALQSTTPVYIDGLPPHYRTPLESRRFHVIPLRPELHEPAQGLLLATGLGRELDPETLWLGRTLSKQMSRLLGRHLLAETRFGQERMLLYSIINAVTDPILLTDTEGKLIIANSHAEKLFAAPDEASEGWRRATALNNMLFSAALSTSAFAFSIGTRVLPNVATETTIPLVSVRRWRFHILAQNAGLLIVPL